MVDEYVTDDVDIVTLPKVSLHDHLDGALRTETIIELADSAGIDLPAEDPDDLADWFADAANSGSLPTYLETFDLTTAVLQTSAALERAARDYVLDLVDDGVVYGEVRWAPEQHLRGALSLDDAVGAVRAGLRAGTEEARDRGHDIRVQQLLCAMRQNAAATDIAEIAVRNRMNGVAGFDIAGPEEGFPPSSHAAAFQYLAEEFMPVTVHAGEGAGLASIRDALITGRALRLGHGARIAEDIEVLDERGDAFQVVMGQLAEWVKDRRIPLELSVSSNLQTGTIEAWGEEVEDHPFDLLYQLGFAVTVNTDNRLQSNTTLSDELVLLTEAFGYNLDDHETFQLNAAEGAFLPVDEREELADVIEDGFAEVS